LRAYNKRLILNLLLNNGAKSKAEIARGTGLSGQASSIIVNDLLADGLLIKLDKIRGQIGQPSTPIAPNPGGAYAIGVQIGRRSVEAALVNLVGDVACSLSEDISAPLPESTLDIAVRLAREVLNELCPTARKRIVGLGVAMPYDIHLWSEGLGVDAGSLDGWRDIDIAGRMEAETGLPVTVYNDAEAACGAELLLGAAINSDSAIYVYLGAFIGSGVVIDGRLYRGEQNRAGAIGSMPTARNGSARSEQLIHKASVILLENALLARGIDAKRAIRDGNVAEAEPHFEAWARVAATELAHALVAAMGVIDFRTIVVDGLLNPDWKERFMQMLRFEISGYNLNGLAPASILTGSIGPLARVIGAATLPLKEWAAPGTDFLVHTEE